ncbi:hypothetical protein GPECTOR_89g506 [Gonium pectorale]|uniref:ATP-dependent RNA helicase n=1 Tax=Gonium pectorale TaxID=33097 RepID=A0A150G0T1_GONPE|nr:hypothetical protein GPECTOR_89g506 [Gonium pectorale]|eukprot:KXZ43486.1 hypothetical protein GPECTOR_89g506 [Gonium pectorale]
MLQGPQALILVPSMELGVQAALAAFRLLGGNISAGRPGDEANMFTYFGPKGIKVRGVLNKEEVVMAKGSLTYLNQVHLVVATPAAAMEAARGPQPVPLLKHLKVLAVDEVDECFAAFPADMEQLMAAAADPEGRGNSFGEKPQVVFVGATQQQEVLERAVDLGWLREPVSIEIGRENAVPPSLSHRYIVVPPGRRLAALAAALRADLAAADADASPARVMLFVNTPAEAAAVAEPLRSSLWADHRMAVLVPPGGIITTIICPEDEPPLLAMAGELGVALVREADVEGPLLMPRLPRVSADEDGDGGGGGSGGGDGERRPQAEQQPQQLGDVERLRRGLEDLFNLM